MSSRRLGVLALNAWPGLSQVWTGQEAAGLILAGSFAASLNLALATRFIWTEAVPNGWPAFFGALAAVLWIGSAGQSIWWIMRCHPDRYRLEIDSLYRQATEFYLQGRWNDARLRIERILALDETDADALMQLGTLYLRAEQPALARQSFRQCLDLDAGSKWRWEIDQALARLDRP